jgi:hypothetical protein
VNPNAGQAGLVTNVKWCGWFGVVRPIGTATKIRPEGSFPCGLTVAACSVQIRSGGVPASKLDHFL